MHTVFDNCLSPGFVPLCVVLVLICVLCANDVFWVYDLYRIKFRVGLSWKSISIEFWPGPSVDSLKLSDILIAKATNVRAI